MEKETQTVWAYCSTGEEVYDDFIAPIEGYILSRITGLLQARFRSSEIMGLKQDVFQESVISLYVFLTEKHRFEGEKWQISLNIVNRIIIDSLRKVVGNRDSNGTVRGNQAFFESNNMMTQINAGRSVKVLAEQPVEKTQIEQMAAMMALYFGERVSAEEVDCLLHLRTTPTVVRSGESYRVAERMVKELQKLSKEEVREIVYGLSSSGGNYEVVEESGYNV